MLVSTTHDQTIDLGMGFKLGLYLTNFFACR